MTRISPEKSMANLHRRDIARDAVTFRRPDRPPPRLRRRLDCRNSGAQASNKFRVEGESPSDADGLACRDSRCGAGGLSAALATGRSGR